MEYFRLDANGRFTDQQNHVISSSGSYQQPHRDNDGYSSPFDTFFGIFRNDRPAYVGPGGYDPRMPDYSTRSPPSYSGPRGGPMAPPPAPAPQWGRQQHRVY